MIFEFSRWKYIRNSYFWARNIFLVRQCILSSFMVINSSTCSIHNQSQIFFVFYAIFWLLEVHPVISFSMRLTSLPHRATGLLNNPKFSFFFFYFFFYMCLEMENIIFSIRLSGFPYPQYLRYRSFQKGHSGTKMLSIKTYHSSFHFIDFHLYIDYRHLFIIIYFKYIII